MKQLILSIALLFSVSGMTQPNLELKNNSNTESSTDEQFSSDSFYNSGVEFYYKKEYGKAIWAFESALKINPLNEDASFNLELINKELEDFITVEPKGVGNWFSRNIYRFSPNFWFYISLFSGLITIISLYLFFTPSSKTINHLSLFGASLFGIVLVLSFTFSVLHKSKLTTDSKALIINSNSNILVNPTNNSEVSFVINEGGQLNIKSIQDDWYELQLETKTGWIIKDSVWVY